MTLFHLYRVEELSAAVNLAEDAKTTARDLHDSIERVKDLIDRLEAQLR